jgi:hypothetical protein
MSTNKSGPIDVICIYRVKKGQELQFKQILAKHGPALHKAGLTPDGAPKIWKSESRDGKTVYIEHMQWKDESSSRAAHQMPEVKVVWEPMGNMCEAMEFLHLSNVEI